MARVDFYVLKQEDPQSRYIFACRLAEKAWRLDNTVHIHTVSREEAARIDELLWTFRDGSFVPHELLAPGSRPAPITIGSGADVVQPRDLLINLSGTIPVFVETFPRVAELVSSDEISKQESRKRFVAYREQGHTLESHDV